MRTLIIFYSLDGSTGFLAKEMAGTIGADLLELKMEKGIKSKGFLKYFEVVMQAITNPNPKLLPFDKNPNDYDLLIIGSPVWAGNLVPSLKSFLSGASIKNKKIGLYCCCGGDPGKTMPNFKNLAEGNEIVGEMVFKKTWAKREENSNAAKEWANKLISA